MIAPPRFLPGYAGFPVAPFHVSFVPSRRRRSGLGVRLVLTAIAAAASAGAQTGTAVVRESPQIAGFVDGSIHQLRASDVSLNDQATITGDLRVPGTPAIRLNGRPVYGGTIDGTGASSPSDYRVTLGGRAAVRQVVRRTDPVDLPSVAVPLAPTGTRHVKLTNDRDEPGAFITVRHLTLAGNPGERALPPGRYGDIEVRAGSLVLGNAGSTTPVIYHLQRLEVEGTGRVRVVGPIVVTVAEKISVEGEVGTRAHPEWLALQSPKAGVSVHGDGRLYAHVNTPRGKVTLHGRSQAVGSVMTDELEVHGNSTLTLVKTPRTNQSPQVVLTAPMSGATYPEPANVTLVASATDADGTIARVEFFEGATRLGERLVPPYEFTVANLLAGPRTYAATAHDNAGASGSSASVTITVTTVLNQPPVVALESPVDGQRFLAPARITLAALATDADGTISRVVFLAGSNALLPVAELTARPFVFAWEIVPPGAYRLVARAYDDDGAGTDSAERRFTVLATLPYLTGFEPTDGFSPGSLSGQGGWSATGNVTIVTDVAFRGAQGMVIAPSVPVGLAISSFAAGSGGAVGFVDFFARPGVAGLSPAEFLRTAVGDVGWVRAGDFVEVQARPGGDALAVWQGTGHRVAVGAEGQSQSWMRVTLRADFGRRRWDLFVDGRLLMADLAFGESQAATFDAVTFLGAASGESAFDDLFVGFENPLFADNDRDGLEDAQEIALGLNPSRDDRGDDPDGDGLSNLREVMAGSRPFDPDSDSDGMPDGWEVRYGLNPLANDATGDLVGDGITNREKFLIGRNPTVRALPDTNDATRLRLFRPGPSVAW